MAPQTISRLRLAILLVLCVLVPSSVRATGSLTIPNTIAAQSGPNINASLLDTNWTTTATYINNREITVDVAANRPVAGTAGRWYFATNTNGGTLYVDTGSTWQQVAAALVSTLAEQLTGLTLSNDGTNPSTVIDFAVGATSSDDAAIANRVLISLTSAITKTTAAWVAGTGNGGLDTGAVAASTWYHVFVIQRVDTGAVDALLSTSATAPTMPTNYTKKRRLGSVLTDSIKAINYFTQEADYFVWATATLDNNVTQPDPTVTWNATMNVPNGVRTFAVFNAMIAGNVVDSAAFFSDLSAAAQAPSVTVAPLYNERSNGSANQGGLYTVRVDTAQHLRVRLTASDANTVLRTSTLAWYDRRGRG